MFLAPTYAHKLGSRHAIGVSAIFAYQRFDAHGLQGFASFSGDPKSLTNMDHANSYGAGARLGYLGELTHWLSVGASYQSRINMGKFDKYSGLFAEKGGFDIPQTFTGGVALKPMDKLTVAFDVQWINYESINSVGNDFLPNLAISPLGTTTGAGFGWHDMTIYKGGLQYEASKDWTYAKQLEIAEIFHKAGYPIGFGCRAGDSTDANQTWGATFGAFGADLVNAKGEITVESDNVMAVMEYAQKMIKFMPPDAVSWDDASNNRALISGKAAYIWNPPSAWAVAKRDAPDVAADCWTFPNPLGAKGRMVPHRPYFWGIWSFAQNKGAAKDLIEHLSQREQVEQLAAPVAGYDIPPFPSMYDMKVWAEVEPPKGTIFNYPARPWHGSEYYVPGSSAPPEIAVQIWNRYLVPGMVARLMSGQTIKQTVAWAKEELEGFVR
jgi:hypothetical protein